jgi:hypothetical protein
VELTEWLIENDPEKLSEVTKVLDAVLKKTA